MAKAKEPCPECGAVEGYDERSGVEVKDGHRAGCQWATMSPGQRKQALLATHAAEVRAERDQATAAKDLEAAEARALRDKGFANKDALAAVKEAEAKAKVS